MTHQNFHSTGLRILQGDNGDIIISDAGWKTGVKMSHTIHWEKLAEAMDDEREATIMIRHLFNFLKRHRALSQAQSQAGTGETKEGAEERRSDVSE